MKLDNMTEVLTLTHPSNNSHYLLNLAQPVYADEETKTLIKMIQLLAEENQYLRKENKRLAKAIGKMVGYAGFETATDGLRVHCSTHLANNS